MDTHHLPAAALLNHLPDPSPNPLRDMTTNARRRAASNIGDLAATFHRFDHRRFSWLAQMARDAGRPEVAKLAEGWAEEHRLVAELLDGEDAA